MLFMSKKSIRFFYTSDSPPQSMILRISYFLIFYDKNKLGEEGFIVANGFRDMVLCST